MKKTRIYALKHDEDKVLKVLQYKGVLHPTVTDVAKDAITGEATIRESDATYELAQITFALTLLKPYAKQRGLFNPLVLCNEELEIRSGSFKYAPVIKACNDLEELITGAKNKLQGLAAEKEALEPWNNLKFQLNNDLSTKSTSVYIGIIPNKDEAQLVAGISALHTATHHVVSRSSKGVFVVIYAMKNQIEKTQDLFKRVNFVSIDLPKAEGTPADRLYEIANEEKEQHKTLEKAESELRNLAKHYEDLQIVHDAHLWKKDRHEAKALNAYTEKTVIIEGWVPEYKLDGLKAILQKEIGAFEIEYVKPGKDEKPPVALKNSAFMKPFESVTRIYGLPLPNEVDPTPFLAVFFIGFFALCLTDAAYGIVMLALIYALIKLLKLPKEAQKLPRLLMYGGVATFFIGGLFGGWFGLTPDQVPEALTYINEAGERMFLAQIINPISNPITVLILAFSLGFLQIYFGTWIKFIWIYRSISKKDAWLDQFPWVFILTAIGFKVLTSMGVLPAALAAASTYALYVSLLGVILTQGRAQKNPIAKVLTGVLALYNLVGYLSDVLSYSRLLALGLATSIIAMAVNVIADLAIGIPAIGWVLAAVIFIFGHIFNLLINALGSFIHSGRLQFVEFFGKFLEGGGKEFAPLNRRTKYVTLKQ